MLPISDRLEPAVLNVSVGTIAGVQIAVQSAVRIRPYEIRRAPNPPYSSKRALKRNSLSKRKSLFRRHSSASLGRDSGTETHIFFRI